MKELLLAGRKIKIFDCAIENKRNKYDTAQSSRSSTGAEKTGKDNKNKSRIHFISSSFLKSLVGGSFEGS